MTPTNPPTKPLKLKNLIAGSVALGAMLALMGIPVAYGLRKLGFTHFGGIIESVAFTRDSYDPGDPLDLKVTTELHRGKERYAQAEIRAHVFVDVDGVEREVGEFREIPADNALSCRLAARMAGGGMVNLEARTFDASLVPAARKAGKVRVVVDEYADGKCVNDAVADISVPLSFSGYDFFKEVFQSSPSKRR